MVTLNPIKFVEQVATGQNPFNTALGNVAGAQPTKSTPEPAAATTPAPSDTQAQLAASAAPVQTSAQQGLSGLEAINPLAMQLFYKHVVSPWLQQVSGDIRSTNKLYGDEAGKIAAQPAMQGNEQLQTIMAGLPQKMAGNADLTHALLGAAAVAPEMAAQQQAQTQLQSLLQQDIAQQRGIAALQDPVYQLQAQAALGGGAGVGGLNGQAGGQTGGIGGYSVGANGQLIGPDGQPLK